MLTSARIRDNHCDRFAFEVTDVNALAEAVAMVLIQEFDLARSIVPQTSLSAKTDIGIAEIEQIIERRLAVPNQFHRDGFLFQLMMWLSSHSDLHKGDLVALPHSQPTAKGPDSIIVHRTEKSVHALSICEDKATKSPRKTIREKVWPEIKDYELGGRDDELRSSIVSTLGTAGISTTEATRLIRGISWAGKRRYRVRVTVGTAKNSKKMFKGFASLTTNGKADCRGETVLLPKIRDWMNEFASKVETALRAMAR